jgi:UDP-2,3-diacylglucosamine hydrolase
MPPVPAPGHGGDTAGRAPDAEIAPAMKPTLFVSDLHLSTKRPAQLDAFHRFCTGPARVAGELYILGDLFDSWIGDDELAEPMVAAVAASLADVAASGVRIGIIIGNRDFLMRERFAAAAGATLLPDKEVIDIDGVPTLIMHGDLLCTSDVGYQRWRRIAHTRRWQNWFLALPFGFRQSFATWLRGKSKATVAKKDTTIMDVEGSAVEAAFRAAGVSRIVHGHTHRPARHHSVVDGRECERFVLADWYERGSYLQFDAAGGHTHDVP